MFLKHPNQEKIEPNYQNGWSVSFKECIWKSPSYNNYLQDTLDGLL